MPSHLSNHFHQAGFPFRNSALVLTAIFRFIFYLPRSELTKITVYFGISIVCPRGYNDVQKFNDRWRMTPLSSYIWTIFRLYLKSRSTSYTFLHWIRNLKAEKEKTFRKKEAYISFSSFLVFYQKWGASKRPRILSVCHSLECKFLPRLLSCTYV
jgi:hypothetical protein